MKNRIGRSLGAVVFLLAFFAGVAFSRERDASANDIESIENRNVFAELAKLNAGINLGGESLHCYKGYPIAKNAILLQAIMHLRGFELSLSEVSGSGQSREISAGWGVMEEFVFGFGIVDHSANADASNDEVQDRTEAAVVIGYRPGNFRMTLEYRANLTDADETGHYLALNGGIALYYGKTDIDIGYTVSAASNPKRKRAAHHSDLRISAAYPLEESSIQVHAGRISYLSDDSKNRAAAVYGRETGAFSYFGFRITYLF